MPEADVAVVEFRLLGPVDAVRNGAPLSLGGPKQRHLLALLLVEPGRPVAVDHLVDELWQGRPPEGASVSLRAYVSKLRAALGEGVAISGTASGYTAHVPPERIDAARFEGLVRQGRNALSRGSPRRATIHLRGALDLWRGRPFGGVADDGALRAEAERLAELRLLGLESLFDAELALGGRAELVDELEMLVREHPFREAFVRQLMLALYRAGRQADALSAFRRTRAVLDEELGLEPGDELRDLEASILRHDVPPPPRPSAEIPNLPVPLTSFIGRERELDALERLLSETRLVTLTGVGGAGKTRLALEAARREAAESPGGVVVVDLSDVRDPARVVGAVAAVLDVREHADVPLARLVEAWLRTEDVLLVLDNCEQVRETTAEIVGSLLSAAPRLRVLATSRETLGVPGEVDFDVPPLQVPQHDARLDELRASEAVRLFLARAREARPRLEEGEAQLATAARICRELDGLPLAIELAAARAKAFTLEEIAARVADRFRFLVSWRRLTAARHRTLAEAMDWSFKLLSDEERSLLERLSVFAGGFTLDAVAAVCLEGDDDRALLLTERLVDASLVVPEEREGVTRYRLLETVREYAAGLLRERDDPGELERRHAEYFVVRVETAERTLEGGGSASWAAELERLGQEYGNVQAALAWSRRNSTAEEQLRIARWVWRFWWVRGDLGEGVAWIDGALEQATDVDPELRAHALLAIGSLAWARGDLGRAADSANEARALFVGLGDRHGEQSCLNVLGLAAHERGANDAAWEYFEQSRDLAEALGREVDVAIFTCNLASAAVDRDDLERAAELYETALALCRRLSDPIGVALNELYLGFVELDAGRSANAAGRFARSLETYRRVGFRQYTAQCVEAIALVAHARGQPETAARLLGAADRLGRSLAPSPPGARARRRERLLTEMREELGDAELRAALSEGEALAEAEAYELAERTLAG